MTHRYSSSYGKKYAHLDGELIVGRGKQRADGRAYLRLFQDGGEDKTVSREHCRLETGPLAVLVTDLGSHRGTYFTPDKKEKHAIVCDVLPPNGSIYVGDYVLTLCLGECPRSGRLSLSRSASAVRLKEQPAVAKSGSSICAVQ